MKIVLKSSIPEPVRFHFTQFALGDISKDFAVTDENIACIFYIGTESNCKKYLNMGQSENATALSPNLNEIDEKKECFLNLIKEGDYESPEVELQLKELLDIFKTKK